MIERIDLFMDAERARFAPERLRQMNLDAVSVRTVDRVRQQLERLCEVSPSRAEKKRQVISSAVHEKELLISMLAGYPDRVAQRRERRENFELLLSGGGVAQLSGESVVRKAEFMVAIDAEERQESGNTAGGGGRQRVRNVVRLASAIEVDWLLDLFPNEIKESVEAHWNAPGERVEIISRLTYGQLILDEGRGGKAGGEEASRLLAEAALAEEPRSLHRPRGN
ncbi:MAG: hypothetical protein WKF84_11675 [Pyrinomonadaceae bacterium]